MRSGCSRNWSGNELNAHHGADYQALKATTASG
jgi:hypothetical protein